MSEENNNTDTPPSSPPPPPPPPPPPLLPPLLLPPPPPPTSISPSLENSITNLLSNTLTNTIVNENDPIISLPIPRRRLPLFHSIRSPYIQSLTNLTNLANLYDTELSGNPYTINSLYQANPIINHYNLQNPYNFLSDLDLTSEFDTTNSEMNTALNNSLNEPSAYRNVISEKAKTQLKEVKFKEIENQHTKVCPIMQDEFEDEDETVILPCTHYFKKNSIMKWLEQENAVCPICRFSFDSVEIKNKQEEPQQPQPQQDASTVVLSPHSHVSDASNFIQELNSNSTDQLIENLIMNLLNTPDV